MTTKAKTVEPSIVEKSLTWVRRIIPLIIAFLVVVDIVLVMVRQAFSTGTEMQKFVRLTYAGIAVLIVMTT